MGGIIKTIVVEVLKSRSAAKTATMKNLSQTSVSKGDMDRVVNKLEQLRSDHHSGMQDLYDQSKTTTEMLYQKIDEMSHTFEMHAQGVKQLVEMVAKMHNLM